MRPLKPFLTLIVFLIISCKQTDSNLLAEKTESKTANKPNVVLILIDDLNHYGVTAYGANRVSSNKGLFKNVIFETPEMDKLANNGVMFTNAHAYPLCEATRIALMSGKLNSRNYLRPKSQHASDITFGDVFQKNGYATGIFGKWKQTRGTKEINGKDYIFEFGWDEFTCFDVITEGQRFINPNLIRNGKVFNYKGRTDLDPETGRRWYGPDICNRDALKFIDNHKDEPFFLYYPMLLVHDEHQPTPDTKPKEVFDTFDGERREGYKPDDHNFFPDMIEYTDKLIGNVVTKLEQHQLLDNTIVVIMGDNGTKESFTHVLNNGEKYPARKGGTTDNGTHVPLIVHAPNMLPQQFVYEGLTNLTDIFPTICDATDIKIPREQDIDGISFWNEIKTQKQEHRDVIYTWYNRNNFYTDESQLLRFAFNKNFKYYAPTPNFPEGRFFDLRTDPFERVGSYFKKRKFNLYLYSGIPIKDLDAEQKAAYDLLKKENENHDYKAVTDVKIEASKHTLETGETIQLNHTITPKNATRNNIIWHCENPDIATINKFGELKALKKGKATIKLYSWDDAYPQASNAKETFKTSGIQDMLEVTVN